MVAMSFPAKYEDVCQAAAGAMMDLAANEQSSPIVIQSIDKENGLILAWQDTDLSQPNRLDTYEAVTLPKLRHFYAIRISRGAEAQTNVSVFARVQTSCRTVQLNFIDTPTKLNERCARERTVRWASERESKSPTMARILYSTRAALVREHLMAE
jgi:hypothetical protein